jgi:hypothetical protein
MAPTDWNWRLPTELQDVAWDCAAASTSWALRTVGYDLSEQDVVAGLGPERISPTWGLLDASGSGIVSYLAELGVGAQNTAEASWQDIVDAAGFQPMVMGGREWCHWVGVRMGTSAAGLDPQPIVLLMNPAPGYREVGQWIDVWQFESLGPFSAVWLTSW